MKSRKICSYTVLAAGILCLWLSGCSSSGSNVVTVSLASSVGSSIILGQSTTITATVTGPGTNLNVNWTPGCQFTTTTVTGTTPSTSTPAACPSDGTLGTLTNEITAAPATATYTAPNKVPDQTKFPGLQIIITAQAQQNTAKTGNVTLTLDSGISVTLTPVTATVPTKEQQLFSVILANDLQTQGVTFLLTQQTATSTITEPNLTTCSPTCGTIQANSSNSAAVYTAPTTVPTASTPSGASTTPANVTIVATAKGDNTRFATGTITIIQGGPITFSGITPTIAPQGAAFWDIYLNAPNVSSASIITLTDQNGGKKPFTSTSGQVKVLFPIPNSTTANPASIGARLRLFETDLQGLNSGNTPVYTVSISDPGEPVTNTAGGQFSFSLISVRPTVISSNPTGIVQGLASNSVPITIDGGYFGPSGEFANIALQTAQNQTIPIPQNAVNTNLPQSNSRQLAAQFPTSAVIPNGPGLYPLQVSRSASPVPAQNNPAVTTLGVFPDYSTNPATVVGSAVAGTNPSAIAVDPTLGIAVVAETGSNLIQFFSIGPGSLTPMPCPVSSCSIAMPTGLSVNRRNHTVAVVSYQNQSVQVFPFPNTTPPSGVPFANPISLGGLLAGVSPAPNAFSIGVDPDTNLALVAFSSTSISSAANLGFVVNLNVGPKPPFGCLASLPSQGPCVFSQVTLNNGQYPQVAVASSGHIAFVTPGGAGIVRGVDVTKPSTSVGISSLSLASGIVTVTTSATLTGIVPGIPTTVLISGVPTTNAAGNTNFNGVFSIADTSSNSFTYALNSTASGTANGGTVFYGSPNLNFGGLSTTAQGIDINPITQTVALADPGQGAPPIQLLNQLDQSVSSISFSATCTVFFTACPSTTEPPGAASVAWQPFTNSIISYNPGTPALPVNQVSISDPVTLKRYAFSCGVTPCVTNPDPTNSGQIAAYKTQITLPGVGAAQISSNLLLSGGVAVDPITNQAFVAESGSGGIQIINLGPSSANTMKPTEISDIRVTSTPPAPLSCPAGSTSGIPNTIIPNATLTSASDMCGLEIFGSNLTAGSQVLLDGVSVPPGNVQAITNTNNQGPDRGLFVTIPASFLALPHEYSLTVVNSGVPSNSVNFYVVKAVDLSKVCSTGPATPSSVAIADQLKNGPFSPIAVVSNSGCNNVSVIDINPSSTTFGAIKSTIAVGTTPQGVAISPPLGLAVVANNGSNNASVVNLLTNTQPVSAVTVGTNPSGVAINPDTGVAIVANTASNTISQINLALLSGSSPATSLTAATIGGVQEPIAIAIDPDRGTNNQGLAVVTGLQLVSGSTPNGALYPVDIGLATPTLSTTISIGSVTTTPTGIVFDPAIATGTANPGLFYVNSSGANVITTFNPDNSAETTASVGINPTALAVNPETGAILTSNFAGQSASILDSLSNPIKTRFTLGLPGSAQFGVAIDPFTNLAVIVDQANNRVFLFPMPN